jgi:hypothetical protein
VSLPSANAVTAWSSHRGRQFELDQTEAGIAQIKLRNESGRFDPTNTGSAYAAGLTALRQSKINVRHPFTGSWHDVFTGYAEDWQFGRTGRKGSNATLKLVDAFELLANAQVEPQASGDGSLFYAEQHVDDRILAALADASFPAVRTDIFQGNVDVQERSYDPGTSILDVIFEAVDAEFPGVANFYISKEGIARFRGRGFRFNPDRYKANGRPFNRWWLGDAAGIAADPSGSFTATWTSPSPGSLDYEYTRVRIHELEWSLGKDHLYNWACIWPSGATGVGKHTNVVRDNTSIGRYGKRALEIGDLIVQRGSGGITALQQTKEYGQYYVNNYKLPGVRVSECTVQGSTRRPESWDFLLGVEIGDLVHIRTGHPGGGGIDDWFFVEGIHNDVSQLNGEFVKWVTKLDLSPKALYASYP